MTILDAYAVIALLRDEPAAPRVAELLAEGTAALTAVGVAEVLDQLVRNHGADEEEATLDLAQLGLLDAHAVDASIGAAAGRLRARHYHRTRCAISTADAIAAETARANDRPLATSDPHLLAVCRTETIRHLPLPATDGSTWTPAG